MMKMMYRILIYSDYFSTYQPEDFSNMGFKLNKVNHSVWFGECLLHTNIVEGIWGKLKDFLNIFQDSILLF